MPNTSPTNDSEDWLTVTVTCGNCYNEREVELSHIGRDINKFYTEHRTRIGRTFCSRDAIVVRHHYLKPEDVEAIIGETEIEWKKPKAMTRNDLRREQRERLSKLNREEEKDAKT